MFFRKKSVIVKAFQMTQEQGEGDKEQWPTWLRQAWINKVLFYVGYGDLGVYGIKTVDGDLVVNYGDYILQGAIL
jgi:hypothetical protein